MGQDLQTVLCHYERVFPLCRGKFVTGDHFPAVRVIRIYEYFPCTHVDHGFDGKDHPRHQQHSRTFVPVVQDIRLFVEVESHAMPAKVTHDPITVLFGMLLDGMADVADIRIGLGGFGS